MPWSVSRREGEFCVTKDGTDEVVGCHASRDDALAQVRALYASETDAMVADIEESLMEPGEPEVTEEALPEVVVDEETAPVVYIKVDEASLRQAIESYMTPPVPAAAEVEEEEWAYASAARPLVAAANDIPTKPPAAWFQHTTPERPGPITISADGRYSGYLALKNVAHIGIGGRRVTAPLEEDYRYFHLGTVETEEGEILATGRITFDTGHADLSASARPAAQHYDNTGSVGADVVAGVDEHGIWVEGALRPNLSDEDIRTLRAAPLSGDWRRIGNKLRLVAALAVNVPGFPIETEYSLAASGEVESLIMADPVIEAEVEPVDNEARKRALVNRLRKQTLVQKMGAK